MSPITSDSLSILFVLAAQPDIILKRDSAKRLLGQDYQCSVDAAAPLLERQWINRHLEANRSMTSGFSITDAGLAASRTITETISSAY